MSYFTEFFKYYFKTQFPLESVWKSNCPNHYTFDKGLYSLQEALLSE